MRLLNTFTGELRWFEIPPRYAILSHVWGKHEQSFQDVEGLSPRLPRIDDIGGSSGGVGAEGGHASGSIFTGAHWAHRSRLNPFLSPKIRGCCELAARLGFLWVWLDTCCIDKTSNTELSEAINSMFAWYSEAQLCIIYLEDVPDMPDEPDDPDIPLHPQIARSRWFTRGWTLQELIAPRASLLVSRGWKMIGTKAALARQLEKITGVDAAVLTTQRPVSEVSVADRMRWASRRETTRVEDRAYSLLGIFNVNMPPLYGEGANAFQRLQKTIMMSYPDQTMFAWLHGRYQSFGSRLPTHGLLAKDVSDFRMTERSMRYSLQSLPQAVERFRAGLAGEVYNPPSSEAPRQPSLDPFPVETPSFTETSYGVRARIPLLQYDGDYAIAVLAVVSGSSHVALVLRRLKGLPPGSNHYTLQESLSLQALTDGINVRGWDSLPRRGAQVTAEWRDVYIARDALMSGPRTVDLPSSQFIFSVIIPSWVLEKIARQGFFYRPPPGHGQKEASDRITDVDIRSRRGKLVSISFTYVQQGLLNGEIDNAPETFEIGMLLDLPWLTRLGFDGQRQRFSRGRSTSPEGGLGTWLEHQERGVWSLSFGDQDRGVRLTVSPGRSEMVQLLDIDLLGERYKYLGSLYRQHCIEILNVADNSDVVSHGHERDSVDVTMAPALERRLEEAEAQIAMLIHSLREQKIISTNKELTNVGSTQNLAVASIREPDGGPTRRWSASSQSGPSTPSTPVTPDDDDLDLGI